MSNVNKYCVEADSTTVIMDDDDDEEDYYIVSVRDDHDPPKQRPSQSWNNRGQHSKGKDSKGRKNVTSTVTSGNQSSVTFQKTPTKKNEELVSAILKEGSPNLIKNLGLQNKKVVSSRNLVQSQNTKACTTNLKCTCTPKPNGFTNKPEEAIAIPDSDDEDSDDCVITENPPSNENLGLDMDCRDEDDYRPTVTTLTSSKSNILSKEKITTISSATSSRALDFGESIKIDEDDDLVVTDQYKLPKERIIQVQEKKPIQHRMSPPPPPPENKRLESNASPVPPQSASILSPAQPVQIHANVHRLPGEPSNSGVQSVPAATSTASHPEPYRTIPTSSFIPVPQASSSLPAIQQLQQLQAMYDATLRGTIGYRPEAVNPISADPRANLPNDLQPQEHVPNRMIEVFPLINPNVLPQSSILQPSAAKTLPQTSPNNSQENDNEGSDKTPLDPKKIQYTDMSPQERIAFLQQALEQEKLKMNPSNTDTTKSKPGKIKGKKYGSSEKKSLGSGNIIEGRKLRSGFDIRKTRSGKCTPLKSKVNNMGKMSNKKNSKSGNSRSAWRSEFARRSSVKAKRYLGANKAKTNLDNQNNKRLQKTPPSDNAPKMKQKGPSPGKGGANGNAIEMEIKRLQKLLDKSQPVEITRSRDNSMCKKRSRVSTESSDDSYKPALKKTKISSSDVGRRKKCNPKLSSKFDEECRKKVKTVKLDKKSNWKKMIKKCKVTLKPIKISADNKVITVTENDNVYKRVDLLYLLEGDDFFTYKNVTFKKHLLRVKEPDTTVKVIEEIKPYHELENSSEMQKTPPRDIDNEAPVKKSRSVAKKRSYVPFGACSSPTKKSVIEPETIVLSDDDDDDVGAIYNAGAMGENDSDEDETDQRPKWLDRLLHSESSRALRANRGPKSIKDRQEEEEEDILEGESSQSTVPEVSTIKKEPNSKIDTCNSITSGLCHVKKEGTSSNDKESQSTARKSNDNIARPEAGTKGSSGIQVDVSQVKKEQDSNEVIGEVTVFSGNLKSVKVENCPDDVPTIKNEIKSEKE